MKNHTDKFKEYIFSKGLKFTPERKSILQRVFACHQHFDTETLYEKLRQKGGNISRATIYRTLPLLVESGLIRETVRSKEKANYEHIYGHEHHGHMLCVKCGKVIEFRDNRMEKLQDAICKKYDFELKDQRISIKGYCKKCKSCHIKEELK